MSEFKLRKRPKRPKPPEAILHEIGNYVSLTDFLTNVSQFKKLYPHIEEEVISIEAVDDYYSGYKVILSASPTSLSAYREQFNEYKKELKLYQAWQKRHTKEIKQAKEDEATLRKRRKLERTKERLAKELVAVEAKLNAK